MPVNNRHPTTSSKKENETNAGVRVVGIQRKLDGADGGAGRDAGGGRIRGGNDSGRTYPHFFYGLGPNARKLLMETYAENRSRLHVRSGIGSVVTNNDDLVTLVAAIALAAPSDGTSLPTATPVRPAAGSESYPIPSPGTSPRPIGSVTAGGAHNNVRHAASAFAAAGSPPDLDANILDRHGVLLARVAEAALRIQRLRRLRALPRAARRLRRRQRAALALQRCFRGSLGRRYADCWKIVSRLAVTRISARWRMFVCRRSFLVLRPVARRGATVMQVCAKCMSVHCARWH